MDKPNILFILADDLGWGDVGFHGSPIRTPVLDELAATGVVLTQHYVCPMCTPTRASLLTGRHPSRFGAHATVPSNAPVLPDGYATLATMLREAGYATGLFGKWHLGSDPQYGPNAFGFDTSYGSLAGGIDPFNHRYKRGRFSVTWHRDGELVEEEGHVTDLLAGAAREWIESRTQPWFCYVPFTAVHVPVKPTDAWRAQYDGETFDADPARDESFKKYAAYTSHMDAAVGELLDTLDRAGQRDNTIVVFTSDNGAINDCPLHSTDQYPGWQTTYPRLGSNAPLRGVKAQLYEGGIRTPTVVSAPGRLEASQVDHPMQVVDWMPTLAALASATSPAEARWDGQDIWPVICGEDDTPAERTLFWNFGNARALGLRRGDWKLIVHSPDGELRRELYDIASDPFEQRDLAGEHPAIVAELERLIAEQRAMDGTSARDDVTGPLVT